MRKTSEYYYWLAVAREALIRADYSPSRADAVIEDVTGDARDTADYRQEAYASASALAEAREMRARCCH
jgi:hypothetical protein